MSILSTGVSHTLETLWGAALKLCLAGSFVMVWSGSQAFGPRAPERFVWILFMELTLLLYSVILAAIAFENPERTKLRTSLALAASLLVMTGAISLKEQVWWPVVAAVALVASRLRLLFDAPSGEEERGRIVAAPLACLALLFVLLWATAFLPLPAWGVEPLDDGAAIWSRFPERALALGTIYYGLLGLYSIAAAFGPSPGARSPGADRPE